jgi:hypothetical protein
MKRSTQVPWGALKSALALGAVGAASLAWASAASAAVIVVPPDSAGTDHLTAAITAANTDADSSNTIVLMPGTYVPATEPVTITKNLTISADHSLQGSGGSPAVTVNGATAQGANPNSPLFVINSGVSVRLEGFDLDNAGPTGFAAVDDRGTLTTYGIEIAGSGGHALLVEGGATATLDETALNGSIGDQILNDGTLNLNNDDIVAGAGNGITTSGGTLNMTSTLVAFQSGLECVGGTATNGATDASIDDDGTCLVQYGNDTAVDSYGYIPGSNGGPTDSVILPAGNPDTTGKGINCPTTDQRFFVNPAGTCDIGSTTTAAAAETSAPSCTVTGGSTGPPATQLVTVSDAGSGLGPESGAGTDDPAYTAVNGAQTLPESTITVASTTGFPTSGTLMLGGQTVTYTGTTATTFTGVSGGATNLANGAPVNLVPTAYPPALAPVTGDAISGLVINNGTFAFTPFSGPSTNNLVITATKSNQSSKTHWGFTALSWAGISKNCF